MQARSIFPKRKRYSKVQCYNCRGFGHGCSDCKKNRNVKDTTSLWRGIGRLNFTKENITSENEVKDEKF